ncbi:hypothetical protein EGW08_019810 [Elysia chlorotica]|uniref:RING-type domain-containing protein n=1 Tax=Elysia chlorotica TaxID=188477 RepID=A0A433ST64_ELYCH|nr:hypothetical protein EGW08_019810 [Elysia chlorotica]
MVWKEMAGGRALRQINLGFHLLVASLWMLASPGNADILVIDSETNVTSPVFHDMTSAFGREFPLEGLSCHVVYSSPADACGPVQAPPVPREDNIGWVLIVARGGHCGFADKVLAAEQQGYDAVIVHNYEGHEALVKMYGNENGSFVNIPSTFVGWQEGMRLKNEYNYTYRKYYVKILEDQDINYRLYLWPFVVVVSVCFLMVMIFVVVKLIKEHAKRRGNRLSKRKLKKIPTRKFQKGDYYDTCAICLDEYEDGERIRVLPCDHVYHTKCIDPWLTKNRKTCPVCKRRVLANDESEASDSEPEDNAPNSTERTPLLAEGSSGATSSGGSQYTNPSPAETQATVFLSGAQQGSSGVRAADESTGMPTDVEENQGAVGGSWISDPVLTASSDAELSAQLRQERASRKSRRHQSKRTGVWEEREDGPSTETSSGRAAETRAEKRERRKLKKERKRLLEELARSKQAYQAELASRIAGPVVSQNVLPVEAPENAAVLPTTQAVQALPGSAGSIQANQADQAGQPGDGDQKQDDESYINPSYSESEEVVLHNPGRRHEMNDMV